MNYLRVVFALALTSSIFLGAMSQSKDTEELGVLGTLELFAAPPPQKPLCPTIATVKNFNVGDYKGRWYEIERYESPFQRGDCGTVDYYPKTNGSFALVKSAVQRNQIKTSQGTGVPSSESGRFHVELPDIPEGTGGPNYNIILTDYDNFAVIHTCEPIGFTNKFEFAWIMGRRPALPEKFLIILKKRLQSLGIDPKDFIKTNQTGCARLPVPGKATA